MFVLVATLFVETRVARGTQLQQTIIQAVLIFARTCSKHPSIVLISHKNLLPQT